MPRKVVAGLVAPVGPRGTLTRVRTLTIDKPGVYENYLVDAEFAPQDAVRIKADGVVLRNCEIRNGARDGIEIYASDVLIENCRIHRFLNGSFAPHLEAHGITGQPTRLTIRNCEISYVSGDCVQFDPGRKPWTDVVIENCVFYDNEISLRLRGPQGNPNGLGGAWVTAESCAFYSSGVAVRLEDRIERRAHRNYVPSPSASRSARSFLSPGPACSTVQASSPRVGIFSNPGSFSRTQTVWRTWTSIGGAGDSCHGSAPLPFKRTVGTPSGKPARGAAAA